jgi:hypothetical protein
MHARCLRSPDGTSNTTGKAYRPSGTNLRLARRWARPQAQSPSRSTLSSTSGVVSASPELGFSYLLPVNPTSDHSTDCGTRQGKLNHRLGKTSASPEQGSNLDIRSDGFPMSPSTGTLTHPISRLFTIPKPCYNYYGMGIPSLGARAYDQPLGLGSQ